MISGFLSAFFLCSLVIFLSLIRYDQTTGQLARTDYFPFDTCQLDYIDVSLSLIRVFTSALIFSTSKVVCWIKECSQWGKINVHVQLWRNWFSLNLHLKHTCTLFNFRVVHAVLGPFSYALHLPWFGTFVCFRVSSILMSCFSHELLLFLNVLGTWILCTLKTLAQSVQTNNLKKPKFLNNRF